MRAGIAGGGLMGCLLAFALHKAGWEVTVFDEGVASASTAAAGLLTPVTELEKNEAIIYQLGIEALTEHWPTLLRELGGDVFFSHQGSIVLAHSRDEAELHRVLQLITARLPTHTLYQSLDQAALTDLEPSLTAFQKGYFFQNEGQLDNQALLATLKTYLKEHAAIFEAKVTAVQPGELLLDQADAVSVDMVFDCRGLGAKQSFSDVRGVRGELLWLYAPDVNIRRPVRLMHPRYSLYLVPRPDHIYLVGASEIESQDTSPISVRTTLELLTAVYSIHKGFIEARLLKTVTQVRPTLTDHLPKIKYTDGLLAINGLYRHGFLIAPSLLADVMQWLRVGLQGVKHPILWEKSNAI